MARIKFKGNRAAAAKAAKAEGESYKVYDGAQPPRAPYRMRLIRMSTKYNANGDPWFSVFAAIDEPAKKNGKTNPKAQYNGATARGSSNQSADYPEMFNAFLSSMGCSKTDVSAIWNTGVETIDNPKGDDFVKALGKVKIAGANLHFFGMVDMEAGGINKQTKKKYPDRLGVVRFLTPNDILGASDSPEDDEDVEEEDELDPDEVDEEEEESEEDADETSDSEDEEAYEERQAELEGMTRTALKALLKPLGSDLRVTVKVTDEQIVEEILGLEFPEGEEASEEEEEEPEDDEEEDDGLASLDRAELKALIKEEELEVRVLKSMSDENIREAITMARGEADDEDEDEVEPPKDKPAAKRRSKSTAGEPPF